MELTVQLFICLLCLTMGSDKQLRKFILTLDVTIPGAPKLIWTRKMSVKSEIVAPASDDHGSQILSHSSLNSEL